MLYWKHISVEGVCNGWVTIIENIFVWLMLDEVYSLDLWEQTLHVYGFNKRPTRPCKCLGCFLLQIWLLLIIKIVYEWAGFKNQNNLN